MSPLTRPTPLPRTWIGSLFVSTAVVAAALVVAVALAYAVRVRYAERSVSVTGSATQRIRSDRVMWTATVFARAPALADAYRVLQNGVPRVRRFLVEGGLPEAEITVGSIETTELYARNEDGVEIREQIIGYELTQPVGVTSARIPLVTRLSQDVTQLIQDGVDVRSDAPEYIYTGLGALKVRLIAEATRDAHDRAAKVARNTASYLGPLVSARVGVVQVNAANESEVSWDGVYDRTSIEKDAMVAVTTIFAVE
ncbi:MAG: SIMPL domain-containing protein [Deltaproteobacteria bacterium]|nr:SIMPL domain-containing protein [Deltaproteobacteria bacterium]